MERDEFAIIYQAHYKAVRNYMQSLTKDPYLAEDITQEAFLRYERYHASFRKECSEYTMICQIAKSIWLNRLRKEKKEQLQNPGIEVRDDHAESFEERIADRSTVEQIHQILHQLPEPYKEVFMLKVFGNLEFKQIAALFQKSESWAKMTYYRGKSKIIRELEAQDGYGKNHKKL